MPTETLTRPSEVTVSGRRSPLLWMLAIIAALAVGVVAGWLLFGDDGTASVVDAEIEQEINALIDDWMTAWNTGDGELAQSLFTADGRYVSLYGSTDLEGWSGEEIAAGVERRGGPAAYDSARVGRPMIIERPDAYHVAARIRLFNYGREYFDMFNIVEEGGSLKIRYTGPWYSLGLMQLAEDLPPQPIAEEG